MKCFCEMFSRGGQGSLADECDFDRGHHSLDTVFY